MPHTKLTPGEIQEDLYTFPYHYIDIGVGGYDLYYSLDYLSCINKLVYLIGHGMELKVLDMGCGDGRLLYELADKGHKLYGIDYSQRAISFAKSFNPYIDYIVGDIKSFDIGIKFDRIILMEVLEHLEDGEIELVLMNIRRHLEVDGRLIITVPTTNLRLIPKHKRHYTKQLIEDTLREYFDILEVIPHSNTGNRLNIFNGLRLLGNIAYPIKREMNKYLVSYYKKYLEDSELEDAGRLIIVCKLKNNGN